MNTQHNEYLERAASQALAREKERIAMTDILETKIRDLGLTVKWNAPRSCVTLYSNEVRVGEIDIYRESGWSAGQDFQFSLSAKHMPKGNTKYRTPRRKFTVMSSLLDAVSKWARADSDEEKAAAVRRQQETVLYGLAREANEQALRERQTAAAAWLAFARSNYDLLSEGERKVIDPVIKAETLVAQREFDIKSFHKAGAKS